MQVISSRSDADVILEEKGIYGENAVNHTKRDADLTYVPVAPDMTFSPTVNNPNQCKFKVKPKTFPNFVTITAENGLPNSISSVRTYVLSGTPYWINAICVGTPSGGYLIYVVWARKSDPFRIGATMQNWGYSNPAATFSGSQMSIDRTEYLVSNTFNRLTGTDWSQPQSVAAFVAQLPPGGLGTGSKTRITQTVYTPFTVTSLSPAYAKSQIDLLIENLTLDYKSPLKDVNYGDLAMKASEKVNANSVNMIAFLRDLREPHKLIPKLRNLKKLKTHANNYLGLQYGVLPTISDLRHIVGAFEKVKPYLDKNGFTTYSAGSSSSNVDGVITETLSQQIKLAIADEDDLFQALASKLESSGFLPTTENLYDLIPYSFVLDWFIDVGGLLHRVDSRLRLARLNIRYATLSRRASLRFNIPTSPTFPYIGSVEMVQYHRWVTDHCPVPPLSAPLTFQLPNHWLEAGALIVTRPKKK